MSETNGTTVETNRIPADAPAERPGRRNRKPAAVGGILAGLKTFASAPTTRVKFTDAHDRTASLTVDGIPDEYTDAEFERLASAGGITVRVKGVATESYRDGQLAGFVEAPNATAFLNAIAVE